ncbi:TPA: hypothetical protein GXZ54_04915 [bacterium]|nr:hypothetical protein [bacterium]
MDEMRFKEICETKIKFNQSTTKIGMMKEKTLHLVIKEYFGDGGLVEHKIKNYHVDVFKNGKVIEIQTGNFDKLRKKLDVLLKEYQVMIVYPIAYMKWVSYINPNTGEISKKRLSPKRGNIYDCFKELYKIKFYLDNPNLSLCLLLIDMYEYKLLNGYSEDKRKGASKVERYPCSLKSEIYFNSTIDYLKFLPLTLPKRFTTKDYASHCKIRLKNAQLGLHLIHYLKIIERVDKIGNLIVYQISDKYSQDSLLLNNYVS